jgi:hypothetical protein
VRGLDSRGARVLGSTSLDENSVRHLFIALGTLGNATLLPHDSSNSSTAASFLTCSISLLCRYIHVHCLHFNEEGKNREWRKNATTAWPPNPHGLGEISRGLVLFETSANYAHNSSLARSEFSWTTIIIGDFNYGFTFTYTQQYLGPHFYSTVA